MEMLLIILIGVAVLVFLGRRVTSSKKNRPNQIYNYKSKDYLMRRDEYYFFNTLVEVFENDYFVFPQVHLSSIIDHKVKGQHWLSALRHVQRKSVDYVICAKAGVQPVLAIELDGSSHDTEKAKLKDAEKDRIFESANIPLLRFTSPNNLSKQEVADKISPFFQHQ